MAAGLGGYDATLMDQHIACWVMNVVPLSGPNTLFVIHDRGLNGVVHLIHIHEHMIFFTFMVYYMPRGKDVT